MRITENQWRIISYLNFKMQCIADQEEVGIELDYDKAVRHRNELLIAQEEKVVELKKVMPKVPKTTKKTKPKITHKKDGTLSVAGSNWFSLLKSNGLSMTFNGELEVITGYEEPNPNSSSQVKDWLFSLGWKPATYKYVRDKATGDERKIEQVRKDGELCPSVLRLAKVEPNISLLEGLSIIQHRLGMFQGFIDSSYVVPDNTYNVPQQTYVKSEIGGLTNTLRFKHKKPIANMPKVGVAWGEEIRGCLIATSPYVFCGSDLSSLEDMTKRHYIKPLDPDYVNSMDKEGFDPHLDLAIHAGAITQEDMDAYNAGNAPWVKEVRGPYKAGNYMCVYGVGAPKLARELGISLKEATKLKDAYWERNWAVKEVAEQQEVKTLKNGEVWLFNPVSGFWHSLRFAKDAWSTLNQSTGVYVFDTWVAYIKQQGEVICMTYHDEVLIQTKDKDKTDRVLNESILKTNKKVQLNVEVGIESKFGKDYSAVH